MTPVVMAAVVRRSRRLRLSLRAALSSRREKHTGHPRQVRGGRT